MDALECIKSRRSIRKFTEQPIEFDKIGQILEAGVAAPTSGNIQNFRFIVITEKSIMKELYNHCLKQEAVYHAQIAIVITGEDDKAELMYGLRGKRLYTIQNTACAAENMLLAAHALGLGACWIGAFDEDKVRTLLDIEEQARPHLILAFGYPDEKPHIERKVLTSFVNFNGYACKVKDLDYMFRDMSLVMEKNLINIHEKGKKKITKLKDAFKKWNEQRLKKKGIRPVMEKK